MKQKIIIFKNKHLSHKKKVLQVENILQTKNKEEKNKKVSAFAKKKEVESALIARE